MEIYLTRHAIEELGNHKNIELSPQLSVDYLSKCFSGRAFIVEGKRRLHSSRKFVFSYENNSTYLGRNTIEHSDIFLPLENDEVNECLVAVTVLSGEEFRRSLNSGNMKILKFRYLGEVPVFAFRKGSNQSDNNVYKPL